VPELPSTPTLLIAPAVGLDLARARLRVEGWTVREGFELPADRWAVDPSTVCVGTVASEAEEIAALLAALRGASLLVAIVDEPSRSRFIADLTHLGPVRRLTDAGDLRTLHPEDAALLAALAEGDSIDSAARRVGMSRRTAHRRLARARAVLGVRTNAAAVARFSSLVPPTTSPPTT
jgi:DNA-binding CsgD family transcriptional regulator